MVRHIVAWSFKDELSDEERRDSAGKIKKDLEALPEIVGGIIDIKVYIDLLPASNKSMVLNSLFESEHALAEYQIHPEHKKISAFVGSVMKERVCVDYLE